MWNLMSVFCFLGTRHVHCPRLYAIAGVMLIAWIEIYPLKVFSVWHRLYFKLKWLYVLLALQMCVTLWIIIKIANRSKLCALFRRLFGRLKWSRNQIVDLKINSRHPIEPIFHVKSTRMRKKKFQRNRNQPSSFTFSTIMTSHRTLLINSEI